MCNVQTDQLVSVKYSVNPGCFKHKIFEGTHASVDAESVGLISIPQIYACTKS